MVTHGRTAIILFAEVVMADKSSIGLYWLCQSFLQGHVIHFQPSGKGLWPDVPEGAHGFDIGVDVAKMVKAWFVMRNTHRGFLCSEVN